MEELKAILEQPQSQTGAHNILRIMKSLGHQLNIGCFCKAINIARAYDAARDYIANNE